MHQSTHAHTHTYITYFAYRSKNYGLLRPTVKYYSKHNVACCFTVAADAILLGLVISILVQAVRKPYWFCAIDVTDLKYTAENIFVAGMKYTLI